MKGQGTQGQEQQARNRDEVIRKVFEKHFTAGATEVPFTIKNIRDAIVDVARTNTRYKEDNVPDVRYEYTSGRRALPDTINRHGPWMIQGRGKGRYAFVKLTTSTEIQIQADLVTILLPNATPEIVLEYAGSDEQGILAKVHYNRLLDIFLQITCYHIQNHWRTFVKGRGQSEIDDLYVALNINGAQFVMPIEAKCAKDHLHKTQIVQNINFARGRYPNLIMRPIGVQEMKDQSLVLIEFTPADHPDEIKIKEMRRYKLVPMSEVPLEKQQGQV